MGHRPLYQSTKKCTRTQVNPDDRIDPVDAAPIPQILASATAPQLKGKMTLVEATTLEKTAKAQLVVLELKRRKGELIEIESVKLVFMEAMAIIANGMDGIPGRLAGRLVGMLDAGELREVRAVASKKLNVLIHAH